MANETSPVRGVRARLGLALAVTLAAVAGCASVPEAAGYYWQSALGQFTLLREARPIDEVIADPSTSSTLRERLDDVRKIRAYASAALGLPDNASYTRYTALDRPYVVWNVFAAPRYALQLKQWCFPVAGCVGYRGYFNRADAEREAAKLREQDWDVFVAGVPAYSTLGWFDDPVLSTFIGWPVPQTARLLFHELAHQVVYLKGDMTFNESFATTVERVGVRRWLEARGDPVLARQHRESEARRAQFLALLRSHRATLEALYARNAPEPELAAGKAAALSSLHQDYLALRASWGGYAGFDRWFEQPPGNAHLGAVSAYLDLVPAFEKLLDAAGGDLGLFYAEVRAIAALAPEARAQALAMPVVGPMAGARDAASATPSGAIMRAGR